MHHRSIVFVAPILILSLGSTTVAVPYKATILDSTGIVSSAAYAVSGSMQFGRAGGTATGGFGHALAWNAPAAGFADLHPTGFVSSIVLAASQNAQVGHGEHNPTGETHAVLWQGTAGSAVDLNPDGYHFSVANGVSDQHQVGNGASVAHGAVDHALLWSGTPESFVDLHPATGFENSIAQAVDGNTQVGYGFVLNPTSTRALLWHGTADSVVDLNPDTHFYSSFAYDVSGNQQVGVGESLSDGYGHALLWNGSADDFVDLHPSGLQSSFANGMSATHQVGYARGDHDHAYVWSGSAASAVDLHAFLATLPIEFRDSYAEDIDANGTIVGHTLDFNSAQYAVIWTPLPEPATLSLILCGVALIPFSRKPRLVL